jgi:FAD binding domain-containing protein
VIFTVLSLGTVDQSADRTLQITQVTPQYSGKCFIESRIDHGNPYFETMASRAGAGMFMSIGSGKLITIQRQGNGSYRNYFGLQVQEDFFHNGTIDLQDVEATRHLLLSDFYADWSEEYKDLIRHITDLRAWPLYTLSPEDMSWKSVPGFTIVGDAAHLTIPNGEGVNVAMTDSLKLASKIAEHGTQNLDRAVQEYEADMFPRGVATITQGKVMENALYSEDPQAALQLLIS